ncbi:MAG: DUF2764 family protein [Candidatus Omnitrophica bacterium]|nr:DUF2764 family protein [Candidatus Omnitrophota bacterium]
MSNYYYFVSQLPMLVFAQKPLINENDFLAEAGKWLNKKDLESLSLARLDEFFPKKGDSLLLKKYRSFESSLRLSLAFIRNQEKGEADYEVLGKVKEACSKNNPLLIENELLAIRWNFLDQCLEDHFFDLEYVIVYYLKLQILSILLSFDKEKGIEVFDSLSEVSGETLN